MTDDERAQYERRLEFSGPWTPKRMAAARPITAPSPAWMAEPEAPAPEIPGVYMTLPVNDPARNPYCRAGRLFCSQDGEDFFASACAIARSGILTAAHTLFRNGKEITSATYVPAYQDHNCPLGWWPVMKITVPDPWMQSENYAYDYGFCLVGHNRNNKNDKQPLGDVTGIFGLAVDRTDIESWEALGYPGVPIKDYPFNGQRMWQCTGTNTMVDVTGQASKAGNLTRGASGGPWLISDSDWVNGVESGDADLYPGQSFSPYFNRAVSALYAKAFGHMPTGPTGPAPCP
jgi:hypothetical protein